MFKFSFSLEFFLSLHQKDTLHYSADKSGRFQYTKKNNVSIIISNSGIISSSCFFLHTHPFLRSWCVVIFLAKWLVINPSVETPQRKLKVRYGLELFWRGDSART